MLSAVSFESNLKLRSNSEHNACLYLTDRLHTVLLNRILSLLEYAQHEIMLFAAAGFLIGSLDDLLVDVIWLCRSLWRRVFIYTRHEVMTLTNLPPARQPGVTAIFVPV